MGVETFLKSLPESILDKIRPVLYTTLFTIAVMMVGFILHAFGVYEAEIETALMGLAFLFGREILPAPATQPQLPKKWTDSVCVGFGAVLIVAVLLGIIF